VLEICKEILSLGRAGRAGALATVVECTGSTPRKEGTKMLIREDGSTFGTVGGGLLEARVIEASLAVMAENRARAMTVDVHGEATGSVQRDGKMLIFLEPIRPKARLVIMGAGHVAKALVRTASFVGFHVIVADDREAYASKERLPDAAEVVVCDFETVFSMTRGDKNTFVVIATRSHDHDLVALTAALRTDAAYIGLLGSTRKKAVLFRALERAGFEQADLDRVTTPVGVSIGSVTPEEIAISIAAQLIQVRRRCGPREDGPPEEGPAVASAAGYGGSRDPQKQNEHPPD